MKKLLTPALFVACLISASLLPSVVRAQFNSLVLGPELGLYGSGAVLGGMIEGPVSSPNSSGGRWAIAGRIDFWSYSTVDYTYTAIPLAGYVDYHFAFSDPRWDLFLGLGLGYAIVSESYSGDLTANYAYNSGLFLAAQVGGRYFFSPNVAIRAELGLGWLPFGVGVDFRP